MNHRYMAAAAALSLLAVMAGCGSPATHPEAPQNQQNSSKPTRPKAAPGGGSACRLPGFSTSGNLEKAPKVDKWSYEGEELAPWPYAKNIGPAETSKNGVRECFAHTPEGALFATANIAAMSGDESITKNNEAYLEFYDKGPGYQKLVNQLKDRRPDDENQNKDVRVSIAGFRILEYDESHAVVDLAYSGSSMSMSIDMSIVYRLVWTDKGDWKLRCDNDDPLNDPVTSSTIPSLSGYVLWSANPVGQ